MLYEGYSVVRLEWSVAVRAEWPAGAAELAAAEREAVDDARRIAVLPASFWRHAPPELRGAVAAAVRGWEDHWPDAGERPAEIEVATRAFREATN